MKFLLSFVIAVTLLCGCGGSSDSQAATAELPFKSTVVTDFREPWAMTFLPDGRLLVTEKKGVLKLYSIGGSAVDVSGVPKVAYGGQGGFGDVVLHPQFASNGLVYLSYAEDGDGDLRGAAVARAKLTLDGKGGALSGLKVIWRQDPKVSGRGHYGHRIAFGPDGYLWISSGERQKFDPAQDMRGNLGKIIRLKDDGSAAPDNPFASRGGVAAQVWSLGHRNPLGIAFDAQGRLWNIEMGPRGGDELNLVKRGANYGYPIVSNGDHYDGRVIPDHPAAARFQCSGDHVEPGDLAGRLHHLLGQRVRGLARRWLHRGPVGRIIGPRRVRRREGARGGALRDGRPHPRSGAGARWRDLAARGRGRRLARPPAEAHGPLKKRGHSHFRRARFRL